MPMTTTRALLLVALAAGCDGGEGDKDGTPAGSEPFALAFAPVANGDEVSCAAPIGGMGPGGAYEIGLSDLRFYVSDLVFRDAGGAEVAATFDEDEFQYTGASGWVALVDLTGNTDGSCAASAIAFSEGTARTHEAITGETVVGDVASVSFDVGVPQALMGEVIGESSVEAAPSPLDEMYWSWASGYRHFVMNVTVNDGVEDGDGYVHIGSTDCAADGFLALEDREACTFVNTPSVAIDGFDLAADTVTIDVGAVLAGLDLRDDVYDPDTFEVIGEGPGASCHSSPMQDDCPTIFANFGLDIATGADDAAANTVFGKR
jgi:uncharacterized repeat protein (TIGR04052 family)